MTKRLTAALLCVAASLTVVGVADAQAKRLPYRTAKKLAKRLAEKQVRGRDVISFHLRKGTRVNARRIVFAYDDRTTEDVYCTARMIIASRTRGTKTRIRARYAGQKCDGIPAEVLAFEAITRRTQRDLRTNTAATVDALDAVDRATRRCRKVKVPRGSKRKAQALFDIAQVEALERPNDAAVGNFAAALLAVEASNPTLAAGAAGWADYLGTLRALPQIDNPCRALKDWARADYSASSAPIDFAAFRALDRRAAVDRMAIDQAATLMANAGAFPNAALGFTPDGLLLQLAVKAGITGGQTRGKLVLG